MIKIIDYGMGNLRSVQKALQKVGHDAEIISNKDEVAPASALVLPGVGAFGDTMENLHKLDLVEPIKDFIKTGKPFLGICLGLQVLFASSEEGSKYPGLGVLPGKVLRFPDNIGLKVPQIGWNQIKFKHKPPIFDGIADGSFMYFVHSYYVAADDENIIATSTEYGVEFTSAVWKDNVVATQFHPEKSGDIGLKILKNFGDLGRK